MSDLYVGYNRACRHPDTLTQDEEEYRHAIRSQGLDSYTHKQITLFVYICLLKQDDYEVWFFFQFSDDNENVCMYMCQQRWCDDTDIDNSMAIVVTMS